MVFRNLFKLRRTETFAIFLLASVTSSAAQELYGAAPTDIKAYLGALVRSYPDWISNYDNESLIMKNGTRFPISDQRTNKSFDELLESPDIDDMFFTPYPASANPQPPVKNSDPGRVRFEPLFVAMYGDCMKNNIAKKFRTIEWLPHYHGGRVAIITANGVDKALEAVSQELDRLSPELAKYAIPPAGTYNCRPVAGSRVRSMHAYGAAIDLNIKYSDYWRWASKNGSDAIWKNQIPVEIVRVFEKHGFIWGGYWYHFDTMHFEYRPELLPAALSG